MANPICTNDRVRDDRPVSGDSAALDFAELFAQLDAPSDGGMVDCGYAELMSRINSPNYRRRSGRD